MMKTRMMTTTSTKKNSLEVAQGLVTVVYQEALAPARLPLRVARLPWMRHTNPTNWPSPTPQALSPTDAIFPATTSFQGLTTTLADTFSELPSVLNSYFRQ